MNKKKWILISTVAGLIAATTAADASDLLKKVNGVQRGDVSVTIDGEKTSLHPVFINGQAYLPAREEADALGYELRYDPASKTIAWTKKDAGAPEEEAQGIRWMGIVQKVTAADDGSVRIDTLGSGGASWMILTADAETAITDASGAKLTPDQLKAGMQITAEYGPVVAMSYPGQSHAAAIEVQAQRLVREEPILAVNKTDDGWQVQFGKTENGVAKPDLTLNAGKETRIIDAEGQSIEWADLKAGDQVRAYYGPIETKSLPPQSPLFYLVKLDPSGSSLAPAETAEYRELAWSTLAEEQKTGLKTAKDDADVALVNAKDAGVLPSTDAQKAKLAELQAANAKLVTVTYATDKDELLGPLVLAFDPDTKTFLGYYARR